MPETLLEVRNLCVDFVTFQGTRRVLDDVTLAVHRGEMMGVVGETGSGKSIFQKAIIGRLPKTAHIPSGEILFDGRDLTKLPEDQMRVIRGQEISLLPAAGREALNPLAPVGVQIANAIRAHNSSSKRDAQQRALDLLRSVAIPDPEARMHAYPHELSSGMAQRVLIAMAIANSPVLILADEPTAGLDVTVQLQVLEIFAALIRDYNSATLMVTRDLGIVAHFCQRVAVMRYGTVYEIAPVRDFFSNAHHPYSQALLAAARASRGETIMTEEARRLLSGGREAGSVDTRTPSRLQMVGDGHFVRIAE
jgi:ABC-type dipeptide/oligopeptide/nickel transport system ATPase component